jgi:serine/threonine protein kinase
MFNHPTESQNCKMSNLLKTGQIVYTESSNLACTVGEFLGSGGQGEVYRAIMGNHSVALKWYYPAYISQDVTLRKRLDRAVSYGPPNDKFLWPTAIMVDKEDEGLGFGYVMQLRETGYKNIVDLMKRRIFPSFRALATAGLELADSFYQLHAKGLSYRDISFGNVFFNPDTGSILICDNDNVVVNGETQGGVLGTPSFMAPEVVRGEQLPNTQTDLYSLAVLLFYMLLVHHPLDGKREAEIRCLDLPAKTKLYGKEPIFIFDPNDESNRPVAGYQDNALIFWAIYPLFLRDRFIKAFTIGLHDPHERIKETIWRAEMVRLRDSIIYCQHCNAENFYDASALKASGGKPSNCWSCHAPLQTPPRIRIGKNIIMLNFDTKLFPHHVDEQSPYNFSQPISEIVYDPQNPTEWKLNNLSGTNWFITTTEGEVKTIEPNVSLVVKNGLKVNFGKTEGEIRL